MLAVKTKKTTRGVYDEKGQRAREGYKYNPGGQGQAVYGAIEKDQWGQPQWREDDKWWNKFITNFWIL